MLARVWFDRGALWEAVCDFNRKGGNVIYLIIKNNLENVNEGIHDWRYMYHDRKVAIEAFKNWNLKPHEYLSLIEIDPVVPTYRGMSHKIARKNRVIPQILARTDGDPEAEADIARQVAVRPPVEGSALAWRTT